MEQPVTKEVTLSIVGFILATTLFFIVTLLVSFFLIISLINGEGISPTDGPNIFMAGLIPPSIATIVLYVKVFGKRLLQHIDQVSKNESQ